MELDLTRLQNLFTYLIIENINRGHSSEIVYSLWGSLLFDLPLKNNVIDALSRFGDPLSACMFFHCRDKGLVKKSFDQSIFTNVFNEKQLYDSEWIFLYEAINNDWCNGKSYEELLYNDPCFSHLYNKGVKFFDGSCLKSIIDSYENRTHLGFNLPGISRNESKEEEGKEDEDEGKEDEDDSDSEENFDEWWKHIIDF